MEFINHYNSYRYRSPIRKTFGSWKNAIRMAGFKNRVGKVFAVSPRSRYSDEELIEMLTIYYSERGNLPTASDCHRGFLPSLNTYLRRFGSFPKAREMAGLPDFDFSASVKNRKIPKLVSSLHD